MCVVCGCHCDVLRVGVVVRKVNVAAAAFCGHARVQASGIAKSSGWEAVS